MVPIHIDISEVVGEFQLLESQAIQLSWNIIDKVVEQYTFQWQNVINQNLKQTRKEYQKAVFIDRKSPTEVIFGLSETKSKLALMLEEGASPFDQKVFFSQSSKRKETATGWKLVIPFRHATPDAVAESGIFRSILPVPVYQLAKNQSGKPVKRNQLPDQYNMLGVREELRFGNQVVPEYVHKSAKYEGLVRVDIGSTTNENRGGYYTFRTVSNNSDPNSWWHSGFEAKKLMDKALEIIKIDSITDKVIDEFLINLD